MSRFRFTPQALTDLADIWSYIAADSSKAADRVESAIYDACVVISGEPLAGQVRKELTHLPLRFWIVRHFPAYMVVYDPATSPLQIIRILHARQNVKRLLSGRTPLP